MIVELECQQMSSRRTEENFSNFCPATSRIRRSSSLEITRCEELTPTVTLQWSLSLSSRDSKEAREIPAAPQSTSSMRLSHVCPTSKVKQTFTEREISLSAAVGNVEARWCRAGPSGSS